ncbi:hypothetical protein RYZ26_10250 [Terasakiella sp. A23]|uniref:hypothetical protein n=1 Tax=Terasakiella sp. FCG-A23 TaxID=3080561 RepID=UPI0029555BD2|nr:hypothetical protein [Terasakiella sp. A23]MDV7339976.1 hypothetical protein [Terasakiella sp. A23]
MTCEELKISLANDIQTVPVKTKTGTFKNGEDAFWWMCITSFLERLSATLNMDNLYSPRCCMPADIKAIILKNHLEGTICLDTFQVLTEIETRLSFTYLDTKQIDLYDQAIIILENELIEAGYI